MNRLLAALLLVLSAALSVHAPALHAQAPVPTTLSYQGVLTDGAGNPVPNGTYTVALRLFPAAVGGTATYAENHTVTTTGGVFAAELGAGTPTTGTWANVAFDQGFWLETAVGGTTLSPRTKLLAGPYARSFTPGARATGNLPGLAASVLRLENTAAGGTNYGLLALNASTSGRAIYASASAASGSTYGLYAQSASSSGTGVYGEGASAGVYGYTTAPTGDGVYGYNNGGVTEATNGVRGRASSRGGRGVFGEVTSTTGVTSGVHGTSASNEGRGVYGIATASSGTTYGVYGTAASTSGYGVYGEATGASGGTGVFGRSTATSGTTYGVHGVSTSPTGSGVYGAAASSSGVSSGVSGISTSSTGRGVFGTSPNYGVHGFAPGTTGRGVFGEATATSGTSFGVYGVAASTTGRGVYGEASSSSGTTYGGYFQSASTTGNGIYGLATATSGLNYGVRGASSSTSGRGVFGSATATSGTTYGGYFQSASAAGFGLYAANTASGGLAARFAGQTRFDNDINLYEGNGTDVRIILDVNEGNNAPAIKLRRNNATVIELDAEHNGRARVITEELEITGGSDLAEHFDVAPLAGLGAPAPGMVVSIDPAQPGRLTVAATPYDPLVAGIVSGAGGVRPGFLMGQDGSIASGDTPVALVGRVYVLVDASYGAVRPGDLLTTSATAGHAMRASDRERAQGAVLGKAMTGLAEGRGLVLVLVGLQ